MAVAHIFQKLLKRSKYIIISFLSFSFHLNLNPQSFIRERILLKINVNIQTCVQYIYLIFEE